ncbi:MAG: NAD(P)/FAD-dependent oxidoreductase [Salibacteraceae bacterium]
MSLRVAVIGGGAAGFFAAISAKSHHPEAEVVLYERSTKPLAKVKVSGGGRCNVTHACFQPSQLVGFYPRGSKQLRKAFGTFHTTHTVDWFESRGVKLKTESDGRMFPITDSSQTVIDCLMGELRKLRIPLNIKSPVSNIKNVDNGFRLSIGDQSVFVHKVIVASGGSPKRSGLAWLEALGHPIVDPVPSLFTFNMPGEPIRELMGLSAPEATVHIQGSKLRSTGPLLITHWGMSGPAILKLSAFGARDLADRNYQFKAQVQWVTGHKENDLLELIVEQQEQHPKQKLFSRPVVELPKRLWHFLLEKVELSAATTWGELGRKGRNRLINVLLNDVYTVSGKTTFKEEFVTCGGVSWEQVAPQTLQSKVLPGLYFAGEVLDVDGVTGGFNFQAAWTTGFIAGQLKD